MRNPGMLVTTEKGHTGRTRNKDHFVNGKVVVYLEDQSGKPVLDEKGQQKRILADRSKIRIRGYID